MKGLKPFLSLAVGLLACAIMVGCAGGIPTNGPSALNIAEFTVNNSVIGISYKFLLVASGGVKPYTWTITSGQLPPGLSLNTDGVISGTPTALGKFTFTAKVVDSQTPTAAVNQLTASITVNPVLSLTATTLPSGTVSGPYNATITASNGLPPYTYTPIPADGSALPPGIKLTTNSGQNGAPSTGLFSGTATAAGVYNFTVQVNDALNEVATAVYTITIVGRLQGPYVLYFNGFKNGQPFYDVAQLVASNDVSGSGQITGTLDEVGPGGIGASAETVNGTYNVGQHSNFGSLSFTRKDDHETMNFSMIVSTSGTTKVLLNNTSDSNEAYGSGLLKIQSASTLAGTIINYGFGLFGNDTSNNRYAGIGMFNLAASVNGTQTVTGGEEDLNDNGSVNNGNGLSQPISITGGSVTQVTDPTIGRGVFSLATGSGTLNYVYYVVSTSELVAVATDASAPSTLVDLLQQKTPGSGGGGFANGSLTGQDLLNLSGLATSNGSLVPSAAVGVVSFDGGGNITRTDGVSGYYTDESDGGAVNPVQYATGTYNLDATCGPIQVACGRVTVNLSGAPAQPVWYLTAPNQAFILDTSPGVLYGSFQVQSPPATGFSNGSIVGYYLGNTITPASASINNELDVSLTPCCGGSWAQTYDLSGPLLGIINQSSFSGAYNCGDTYPTCNQLGTSLGRFIITGPGSGTSDVQIMYVVGAGTGSTGANGGVFSLNVGSLSDGTPDPAPRITEYSK